MEGWRTGKWNRSPSVAVSGSTGRSPLVSAAPHRSIVVWGPVCAICRVGWFAFISELFFFAGRGVTIVERRM